VIPYGEKKISRLTLDAMDIEEPNFLGDFIWLIHMLFVALNVVAPFSGSDILLRYHVVMMPFLYVHWMTNDDTCALTIMEERVRGLKTKKESFFHKIVSPVYKYHACGIDVMVWVLSYILWAWSMIQFFA